MSLKPHSPGCGCNCPQYLFAPTESIFPDRPSDLGSRLLTLFPLAEGTISGTSYLLDAGESLAPSPGLIHCGRAWFHEIDIFDGDADITWDGGVIEFRQAGTITVAGVAADIMPDDATIAYSRVVLYVTDSWYMVAVIRYHTVASVAGTTTRGSIQIFNRVTDVRNRSVSLEAVGEAGTSIRSWYLGDATVMTSGDYLGDYYADYLAPAESTWTVRSTCYRPALPAGTEAQYQHQRAASDTFGGYNYPATFDLVGDIEGEWVRDYTCNPGSVASTHNFAGVLTAGILRPAGLGFGDYEWLDLPPGSFVDTSTALVGPWVRGRPSTDVWNAIIRSEEKACCPATCGGTDYQNTQRATASWFAGSAVVWPKPTGTAIYPKPVIRHLLIVDTTNLNGAGVSDERTQADTAIATDGTAAATIAVYATPDGPSAGILRFTEVGLQWDVS